MKEETKRDLTELMRALQELSYGLILTCGTVTVTKVISAAEKVILELENE